MHETSLELIAGAVNARPIISSQGLLERIFNYSFGGFVYNQIWEDPEVDVRALQLDAESRVMAISSGGCNVLNYLLCGVASIDAVDLNSNHLHLLKLKLCGLARFPTHEDFFAFFGEANNEENGRRYRQHLSPALDESARAHWEGGSIRQPLNCERFRYFERGLWRHASVGTFLRCLHAVARSMGARPERLLTCQTLDEQETVFQLEIAPFFESPVLKGITRLPFLLHGFGVPPRQFEAFRNETGAHNVHAEYRRRVQRLACQFAVQTNYFAWQAFGGRYDLVHRRAIPEYLKAHNFPILRAHVRRVRPHLTSMTGFLSTLAPGALNRFVLLDSQDWMTPDQLIALWRQIARVGQSGSRIIFRTGAAASPVEAALPADLRSRFVYLAAQSKELFQQDRSAIYGGFHLYVMN